MRPVDKEEVNLAWRPYLMPGAVVAFHDYNEDVWPGVADAVAALSLDGETAGGMFVWRNGEPTGE